uniref:Uncharacterized protein n=1 Tax=Anopheles culicifacies TaxID=139723 RepID=A0A182MJ78_9DIPT
MTEDKPENNSSTTPGPGIHPVGPGCSVAVDDISISREVTGTLHTNTISKISIQAQHTVETNTDRTPNRAFHYSWRLVWRRTHGVYVRVCLCVWFCKMLIEIAIFNPPYHQCPPKHSGLFVVPPSTNLD